MHDCTLQIESFAEVYTLTGSSVASVLKLGRDKPGFAFLVIFFWPFLGAFWGFFP